MDIHTKNFIAKMFAVLVLITGLIFLEACTEEYVSDDITGTWEETGEYRFEELPGAAEIRSTVTYLPDGTFESRTQSVIIESPDGELRLLEIDQLDTKGTWYVKGNNLITTTTWVTGSMRGPSGQVHNLDLSMIPEDEHTSSDQILRLAKDKFATMDDEGFTVNYRRIL